MLFALLTVLAIAYSLTQPAPFRQQWLVRMQHAYRRTYMCGPVRWRLPIGA